MRFAVEMGSDAMIYIYIYIYIPSFINIAGGGKFTGTQTA
jgi:hypothetical protein